MEINRNKQKPEEEEKKGPGRPKKLFDLLGGSNPSCIVPERQKDSDPELTSRYDFEYELNEEDTSRLIVSQNTEVF